MNIPLSLNILIRFNINNRKEGMISIISFISIISIALGMAVLIIGFSAMNGFERELKQRILAVIPHGEIEPVIHPFFEWKNMLENIEKMQEVVAAAPYIHCTGLIEFNNNIHIIQVKGVDPKKEIKINSLSSFLEDNEWKNFREGKKQIILGKGISDRINAKKGDWIHLIISKTNSKNLLLQPTKICLQVNNIFSMHSYIDNFFAFIPLSDAQFYLDKDQDIDGISIKFNDIFRSDQLLRKVGRTINDYVYIRSWMNRYGYMYRDIKMIRTIIFFSMVLVIVIACFNISSTLIISVRQRSADIAILRTIGAKKSFIHQIFIWYGLLTSLSGNILGMICGIPIAINLTILIQKIEDICDHKLLPKNIYFINFIPTDISWLNVISFFFITLLLSLFASWYPARRASNISPSKILSGQF